MAGDELDDGLEYSFTVSPTSPHELDEDQLDLESDTDQGTGKAANKTAQQSSKRKLEQESQPGESQPKKQKKKNQKKKDEKRSNMEAAVLKKRQLGLMDPANIADYIALRVPNAKDLSSLEVQDQAVAQASIVDSSEWQGGRDISRMATYIKDFKILDKSNAKSLAVVLHISAIRACDACRSLRSLKMPIGKLIPKNKPAQDHELLAKKPKLVVATPGRIRRLISDGILDATSIANVIVEASFIDKKANSVLDLPETIPVLNKLSQAGAKVHFF